MAQRTIFVALAATRSGCYTQWLLHVVWAQLVMGTTTPSNRGPSTNRSDAKMLGAIIFWIIVGLIAGVLAKWVMPGDDPGGIVVTIIIGIAGAVVGGFLLRLLGIGSGGGTGQWIASIVAAFIGAVILLDRKSTRL